jgi:large subunit ribosomal protein L24
MNFSTNFKASVNPRKQRLYVYHAPLHIKSAMLASHLSKELRQKTGKRALRVRVGDKVVVITGQHRKKQGKVERVDIRRQAVFVAGIERQRKDGSKAAYPFHPSNLVILEIVEDKRRVNKQRKAPAAKPAAKPAPKQSSSPKPAAKPAQATTQKKGSQ